MPVDLCSSAKRVSERFQGKKEATVSGALPPLAAQASKYAAAGWHCPWLGQPTPVLRLEATATTEHSQPAATYQCSDTHGLIFQRASVAQIENIIIAKRPAHSASEP